MHIPATYDGSSPSALFVTLPGWEGLYFQGVGENLRWERFGQESIAYNEQMIVLAPQLNDWGQTSADQTIELVEHFVAAYNVDATRVYIEGYSGGGETLSLVMGKRPELFAAAMAVSSQWDGDLSAVAEARTPLRLFTGRDDSYYGSSSFIRAADELRALYVQVGLAQADIDKLVVLDIKETDYYVSVGNVCAAVNGQTGKVAVRGEKTRKTTPWWVRPIAATLVVFVVALAIATALLGNWEGGVAMAGMITLVMGLIFYTAFSNAYEGTKRQALGPKIYTSDEVFERAPDGSLHAAAAVVAEDPVKPVFFEDVDDARVPVEIRFTTPWRTMKMALLALFVLFLPIIIAFVLNGFSANGLHPEGAAVWLCIFAIVVPAYYIKMGRVDIYENPYIYVTDERGRRRKVKTKSRTTTVRDVLSTLFSKPLIAAALALLLFLVMGVYLTLGN